MGLFINKTSRISVLKVATVYFEAEMAKNNILLKEIAKRDANVHSIYEYQYSKYNDTIALYAIKEAYELLLMKS